MSLHYIMRNLLLILASLWLLNACTSVPDAPLNLDQMRHQAQLAQLTQWRLKGKLGFKSPEETFSANLNWQQQDQTYEMKLTTFLGIGLMNLRADGRSATLKADDQVFTDTDATTLIRNVTGWQIPVERLSDWIKGSANDLDAATFDDKGLLTQLDTDCGGCGNWSIEFSRYKAVDDIWLPHGIVLTNRSAPDNQIRIKVNAWTLN